MMSMLRRGKWPVWVRLGASDDNIINGDALNICEICYYGRASDANSV